MVVGFFVKAVDKVRVSKEKVLLEVLRGKFANCPGGREKVTWDPSFRWVALKPRLNPLGQ